MTRVTALSNPLLLGFEEIERLIGRAAKGGGDGYPPYNIERIPRDGDASELLRITWRWPGLRAISSTSPSKTSS